MKAIITFTTICALLCAAIVKAQTNPPKPPKPPVASSHSDTTSSSTSSSYNVTTTTDDDSNKGGNISISISDNNSSYSMSAKFPDNKISEVHDILRKELGQGERVNDKDRFRWESNISGDEVYKVDLRGNKLSIALDKDLADEDLVRKFKNMGKLIRNAISGKDVDAEREAQNLQREADRLQREADRMRRESERMQREADRLKENQDRIQRQVALNATRYERDALRLAEEGMRIAEEASRLNQDAVYGGGISDMVDQLLQLSRTKMTTSIQNINNWIWPSVQNALLKSLNNDNLITSGSEVVFSRDRNGIFVNGKKVNVKNQINYDRLLLDNGISMSNYFTFYKKGDHIVIVDNMARIEPVLNDMQRKGIIADLSAEIEIAINGATAAINGKEQASNQVIEINKLLNKHNIIGAPGKMIKISGSSKTLGYSNGKAHLGTWIMKD